MPSSAKVFKALYMQICLSLLLLPNVKILFSWAAGQISIVQSLLEELPGQFLTYMRSRDIKPRSVDTVQTSGS